jgi:signal peptidase II
MVDRVSRRDAKVSQRTQSAFVLAAAVFFLDRVTKYWVESRVATSDTCTVIPGFFSIIHTHNRGAAFGLFSGAQSGWQTLFLVGLSVSAMVLITSLLWRPSGGRLASSRRLRLGLSLVLGGALGNLYDRLAHGAVTDFLELYVGDFHWPTFNVADSAITIGAALLMLDMLRSRQATQRK